MLRFTEDFVRSYEMKLLRRAYSLRDLAQISPKVETLVKFKILRKMQQNIGNSILKVLVCPH